MRPHEVDTLLYHSPCLDGFSAAWVASRYMLVTDRQIELIPVVHGELPPRVDGKRVLIIDFSYPRDMLLELKDEAEDLLVLDHHSDAEERLAGLDFAVFDQNRSGAGLAWDFFFPSRKMPAMLQYIQDRDLWKFDLGDHTREWHAYLSTFAFDLDVWTEAALDAETDTVWRPAGQAILRYQKEIINQLVADARMMRVFIKGEELWRWKMPVANASRHFVSEVGHALAAANPNHPGALVWSFADGKYVCSLRALKDGDSMIDIARMFGGGGHRAAAGFRARNMEFVGDSLIITPA